MRKPNFFIIGAPKCGTTSLATYLSEHPKIFFPAFKELHFFNTDMAFRTFRSGGDYYAHFRDAGAEHTAVGEGSVLYLYSDAAVPNILETLPDSRFIVMVRNPIDMAVSYYAQVRYGGYENIPDFATAWRVQEARRNGTMLPKFCTDPSLLLYGRMCSLGWQIKRLHGRVPPNRVLVLFQDDLKRDSRAVYLRTLEFLGVPDDGKTVFDRHNQRQKPVRSQFLQAGIRYVGNLKRKLGIEGNLGILPMIQRLNTDDAGSEMLEPQFRAELADYFRNDVEELSAMLGRDLSAWLQA